LYSEYRVLVGNKSKLYIPLEAGKQRVKGVIYFVGQKLMKDNEKHVFIKTKISLPILRKIKKAKVFSDI